MFELQPHQERAVAKMHNGSILFAEPGTGKTHTAIGYYLENEAPKDIYVITTAKKRDSLDWERTALEAGITTDRETTLGSVITVDSWNNVNKYQGVVGAFFIFDEQRLVGSGAWVKAFLKIAKANHWILLSATPGDTWLDYIPVFIANGFVRNRTEFKQDYVVYAPWSKFPKVIGYRQVGKLVRWKNSLLVHMPYDRHTVRTSTVVPVRINAELLRRVVKDRWHVYENRPLRDVSELFAVMKKVVYTDASRTQAVRTLLRRHPKLIVFYQYDYELDELRKLGESLSKRSEECQKEYPNLESNQDRPESCTQDPWNYLSINTEEQMLLNAQHVEQNQASSTDAWTYLLSPEGMRANTKDFTISLQESSSTTDSKHSTKSGESCSSGECTTPPSTSEFQTAEWNGHKHEPIPRTESWLYLVQYVAGSEAWNCIETDAMCFWSRTYSYKIWHQAHGRIDRLNTPFAKLFYYELDADTEIERAVVGSLRAKKSFNEVDYVRSWQAQHPE